MFRRIKDELRKRIAGIAKKEVNRSMEEFYVLLPQLIAFHTSKPEERQDFYDHTKNPEAQEDFYRRLRDRLSSLGVTVEDYDVDVPDFEKWLRDFPEMRSFYESMGRSAIQKCMEHYLVYRLLKIGRDDIYIDIAAHKSPWAKIVERQGVCAYRLDMDYPPGIHGRDIGADAADTKLADGFASVLSAQCSFNCFSGDADIRFLREASRILNRNGRVAVVPLCMEEHYTIQKSPYCDLRGVSFDPKAKTVWRTDEYRLPFSRMYSPEAFVERIYRNLPADMRGKVLYLRNLPEVMRRFEGQRIYGYFMFCCEKMPATRVSA